MSKLPPGPKPKPLVGNLLDLFGDPPAFYLNAAREYGDLVSFKLGNQPCYFVNHPDWIREVLVTQQKKFTKGRALEAGKRLVGEGLLTSEGEIHLQQRRMIQPAFHRQQIATYATIMVDFARRRSERWREGQAIDIAEEMMELALAIIAKSLFNADVEREAHDVGRALDAALKMFRKLTIPFYEKLEALPLPSHRRFRWAKSYLDSTIYRIISERRKGGADLPDDLLSRMIAARDEEGDGRRMTDQELRDQVMTLFLAGHETTANGMAWAWYALAQNPDCETKLAAEIASVIGERAPTADDVAKMPYARCFVSEVFRLYPPVWNIARRLNEPLELGGYTLAPGSIIVMSPFAMHRDPRFYENPERFDPERWAAEDEVKKRPKFSFFPFGGGPRVCVAEPFAWMEMTLLLVTIAQHWRFELAEPGKPVRRQAFITMRPKGGLRVIPRAR